MFRVSGERGYTLAGDSRPGHPDLPRPRLRPPPGTAGARPGLPARALVRPRPQRLRQPAPAPGPAVEKPGDPREAVEARRRLLDAGYGGALLRALLEEIAALGLPAGAAVLDVGCGEGYYLGSLAREPGSRRTGSTSRRRRSISRRGAIPGGPGSWPTPTAPSLGGGLVRPRALARRPAEPRRSCGGCSSPAGGCWWPCRRRTTSWSCGRPCSARAAARPAGAGRRPIGRGFELEARRTVRETAAAEAAGLRDALAATYRGARESRRRGSKPFRRWRSRSPRPRPIPRDKIAVPRMSSFSHHPLLTGLPPARAAGPDAPARAGRRDRPGLRRRRGARGLPGEPAAPHGLGRPPPGPGGRRPAGAGRRGGAAARRGLRRARC